MNVRCDTCLIDLGDKRDINCSKCGAVFCSIECQKKENGCCPPDANLISVTLRTFFGECDISSIKTLLPVFNNLHYLPLPGPISDPIPSTFYKISDEQRKSIGSISPCAYYMVCLNDLPRAFWAKLNKSQRQEISNMISYKK